MNILVILASFNGEKYINAQIESILNQENVTVFIKVFDDKSTDGTRDRIANKRYDKVEVIENAVASGSAANNFLNSLKSLSHSELNKYKYIAFADQDDIWSSNKLFSAITKLITEDSSLYASNLIMWNESDGKKTVLRKDFSQQKFDFLFEGASAGCTYVFTIDFCKKLQLQLDNINYQRWHYFSHDWYIYFFARINKIRVSIDSSAFIEYRIHQDNVHGHLNVKSFAAVYGKIQLVRDGWYVTQIEGFKKNMQTDSPEYKIYELYMRSWWSRLYVLFTYNFSLMRSKRKFIIFALLSLCFFNKKNNTHI